MRCHNICFYEKLRNIIPKYSLLSRALLLLINPVIKITLFNFRIFSVIGLDFPIFKINGHKRSNSFIFTFL